MVTAHSSQFYTASNCLLARSARKVSLSSKLNFRVATRIFTPSNTNYDRRVHVHYLSRYLKCIYTMTSIRSITLSYCVIRIMENVGSVSAARTKFMNFMYVYHSVRKPGWDVGNCGACLGWIEERV